MAHFRLLPIACFVALSVACDGQTQVTRCNGDSDCSAQERCVEGVCETGGTAEPSVREPEPSPDRDGGAADDGGPKGIDGGTLDGGEPVVDAGPNNGWHLPQWPSRVPLTFPAVSSETVFDVVLPLSLGTSPEISNDPSLRLLTQNGEPVPFERAPQALWVRVSELPPDVGTTLWAYFGRPNAPPFGHPADPWVQARGVWHLDAEAQDSSRLTSHGEAGGENVAGVVGRARELAPDAVDATGIVLPAGRYFGGARQVSVALWARLLPPEVEGQNQQLLSFVRADSSGLSRVLLQRNVFSNGYFFRVESFEDSPSMTVDAPEPEGQWVFIVAIADFDESTMAIFVDGIEAGRVPMRDNTGTLALSPYTRDEVARFAALGAEDNGIDEVLNGSLDEVRLLERALPPAHVDTLYQYEFVGGTLASFGDVESNPGPIAPSPPSPVVEDDTAIVLVGEAKTIDVRANDQASRLTVVSVSPAAAAGEDSLSAAVLSDGRIRLTAAASGSAQFDVTLSDGVAPPVTSRLDVEAQPGAAPQCHQLDLVLGTLEPVVIAVDELIDPSTGDLLEVAAGLGTASFDGNAVLYTPPNFDPELAVRDFLRIVGTSGVADCQSSATIDFALNASIPASVSIPFDANISRQFAFPFDEAGLDPTSDTVVFRDPANVIEELAPGMFAFDGDSRETTLSIRYDVTNADGATRPTGLVVFEPQTWADPVFTERVKVTLLPAAIADADLDMVSLRVDLNGLSATALDDGVRLFAPGSREPLPMLEEGGQRVLRTQLPRVVGVNPAPYFWAYFGPVDSLDPPPTAPVWNASVVGAWGLGASLTDQTGNGHDAIAATGIDANADGALLDELAGGDLQLPALPVDYPLTVEAVFAPTVAWELPLGTQTLATVIAPDEEFGWEFGWAGDNYGAVGGTPVEGQWASRYRRVIGGGGNRNVLTTSDPAAVEGARHHHVALVLDEPTAAHDFWMMVDGGSVGNTQSFGNGTLESISGLPWTLGPAAGGGVSQNRSSECFARLRSIRVRQGAMSLARARLQNLSETGQLLSIAEATSAPD